MDTNSLLKIVSSKFDSAEFWNVFNFTDKANKDIEELCIDITDPSDDKVLILMHAICPEPNKTYHQPPKQRESKLPVSLYSCITCVIMMQPFSQ